MKPPISTPSAQPATLTLKDSDYGPALPLPVLIVGEAPGGDRDTAAASASASASISTRDLVIRLRFEESLPFPEIAERLGVTRALVYKIAKDERLRRRAHGANDDTSGEPEDDSPASLFPGCRVCGVVPVAPAKLRANGLCRRHAHRLERYGDAEIELRGDRPAVCESCGKACGGGTDADGAGKSGSRASGRVRGADGKYRCQSCAWREDPEYRARHQALTKRWRERTRGKRILNDALSALSLKAAAEKITYVELSQAAIELNAALYRLRTGGE